MSRISSMPENQKEVLIIFDEMALRVHFCYDSSADQVVGFFDLGNGERKDMPAEEVLVVMIRSIYGEWKQPFAFWFTHSKLTGGDFYKLFAESIGASKRLV